MWPRVLLSMSGASPPPSPEPSACSRLAVSGTCTCITWKDEMAQHSHCCTTSRPHFESDPQSCQASTNSWMGNTHTPSALMTQACGSWVEVEVVHEVHAEAQWDSAKGLCSHQTSHLWSVFHRGNDSMPFMSRCFAVGQTSGVLLCITQLLW